MADADNAPFSRDVSVSRTYPASRALVFAAFTEPAHLRQWFAPRPYTLPHCEVDLRPGGQFRYAMRAPDGAEHWVTSVYTEVVAPERLAMSTRFEDLPDLEFTQSVTFTEAGGETTVVFAMRFPPHTELSPAQLAILTPRARGASIGTRMSLDQLGEVLAR